MPVSAEDKTVSICPHVLLPAEGRFDALRDVLKSIRDRDMAAGIASHRPELLDRAVEASLEPDAAGAEERMQVNEIWGKPIVIENVPLERYDLEDPE